MVFFAVSFLRAAHDDRHSLSEVEGHRDPLHRRLRLSLVLIAVNVILAILFGLMFSAVERPAEVEERTARTRVLMRHNASMSAADWTSLLARFGHDSADIRRDIGALEAGTMDALEYHWDFSGSVFYAFTLATSIGYGSFTPVTPADDLDCLIEKRFADHGELLQSVLNKGAARF